jgi:hypothetical protein
LQGREQQSIDRHDSERGPAVVASGLVRFSPFRIDRLSPRVQLFPLDVLGEWMSVVALSILT